MKSKILKLSTFVLLLLFIGTSCQKDEIEYADESIEISSMPEISVFKTKGDYFYDISFQLTQEGFPNGIPDLRQGSLPKPNNTYRLKSGYVVGIAYSVEDVYTDITYKEYIEYNTKNGVGSWPDELLKSRIIDQDPYLEFYNLNGINKPIRNFTLGEINEMIESGTLETIFKKLK